MALPTGSFLPINFALESSFVNFLTSASFNASSSLSGSTFPIYTGINNQVKAAPACVISVVDARETYYQTNVFEATVEVGVFEMAYDTSQPALSSYAMQIFSSIYQIPGYNVSSQWNNSTFQFCAFQVQTLNNTCRFVEDALENVTTFKVICALTVT